MIEQAQAYAEIERFVDKTLEVLAQTMISATRSQLVTQYGSPITAYFWAPVSMS
ncbi:MAG: hypothetical protein IPO31_25085 [Candidatus Obscuribacter sp.]|nr:hypothetical protein [Candidatus Obscuribacter sp.]